tara:strand:- start:781 stop:1218 length:438 start_codon:yes stop_codon:yes gene_type:complete
MGELSFSCEIDCDKDKFFHVLTDFQNLTDYMPRQLQKISIIEEKNDYTIIESTIFLRSIIKKEFLIPVKLHINSENKIILEILDGVAKGTQSTISFEKDGQKNICNINTNVKLSLKAAILHPIIKKEYEGFLTKVSRKVMAKINE